MKPPLPSVITLTICLLLLAFSGITSAQPLNRKDASRFKKAEKQYVMGKFNDAEQNYKKIILTSEHGRSLKRLGDIESLARNNPEQALSYYTKALPALKADLATLQATGDRASISEAEEWLGACEKGVSISGGKEPENQESSTSAYSDSVYEYKPSNQESAPVTEKETSKIAVPENKPKEAEGENTTEYKSSLKIESDGIFFPDLNKRITFYKKGSITSYFAYAESPLSQCTLPNPDELKTILTSILQSSDRNAVLMSLEWGDRESIVFISDETFFDDVNDHKCTAFIITKESRQPEKTAIDLGEMTSVILIKHNY